MSTINQAFKQRLVTRELLTGTFVKTPHPIIIEILASAGFDFAVLDAEHAPFDRSSIDNCLIAGRACDLPLLVRVPDTSSSWILNTLDAGAAGLVVPHVTTISQAEHIVASTRYQGGIRGFAGTTRAANYGRRGLKNHLLNSANDISLVCQIEDPEGVLHADAIAAVEGVDALFVGRADLAVGLGKDDFFDADVAEQCAQVLAVQHATSGLYCAPGEPIDRWCDAGASLMVIGSEHTMIQQGGQQIIQLTDTKKSKNHNM